MIINKPLLIIVLILNILVLTGQIWPEGAPIFARLAIIIFLIMNLVFLIYSMTKSSFTSLNEASKR